MAKTIQEVLEMAQGTDVVDIRFTDLPGTWQHFTMPTHRLTEDFFEDGIPFDGSSIRGFQEIHESDMLLKPDPDSAFLDPTAEISTLVLSCNVYDPLTFEAYSRDPRYVALKAENYLKSTGIAETAYFAPEAEFFVFDGVRYASNSHEAFYSIHSEEAWWTPEHSDSPNYGGQILPKRGYFPVPPTDTLQTLRTKFMLAMEKAGVQMDLHLFAQGKFSSQSISRYCVPDSGESSGPHYACPCFRDDSFCLPCTGSDRFPQESS